MKHPATLEKATKIGKPHLYDMLKIGGELSELEYRALLSVKDMGRFCEQGFISTETPDLDEIEGILALSPEFLKEHDYLRSNEAIQLYGKSKSGFFQLVSSGIISSTICPVTFRRLYSVHDITEVVKRRQSKEQRSVGI